MVFKTFLFNYAKSITKTCLKKMARVKKVYQTFNKNNTIFTKIKDVEKKTNI